MNSLTFCLFFCLSSSLGLSVSFATSQVFQRNWDRVLDLFCKRHNFIYHRGDYFSLLTTVDGKDSDVMKTKVEVLVKKPAGTILFRQRMPIPFVETVVDINLDYDKITIDVQLSTADSCELIRVLEGTEESTLSGVKKVMTSKNNNICLKGSRCMLILNVSNNCTDPDVKLKYQPCKVDRDEDAAFYEDEEEEARKTLIAARNFLDFITQTNSSTKNAPNAPNASNALNTSSEGLLNSGADNTYFTIMIVALVVAAVVTIMLVLIIIRLCWNPRVPYLPQFSPIDENRYYENVVFRPKSEQEAVQQEPRIYDEPSVENSQEASNRRPQLN